MTRRAIRTQVLMDKIKVAFEGRKETLSHLKVCRLPSVHPFTG
jgi:hypothetical protein